MAFISFVFIELDLTDIIATVQVPKLTISKLTNVGLKIGIYLQISYARSLDIFFWSSSWF